MDKRGTLIFIAAISIILIILFFYNQLQSNSFKSIHDHTLINKNFEYKEYSPNPTDLIISRSDYANKLYCFWLG